MFKFLKSLFSTGKQHLVMYDADQVSLKTIKRINSKVDPTKARSIIFCGNPVTKEQQVENCEWFRASPIAKEAVDTAMTAFSVQEIATNPNLKEVHYFSSDADAVGTAVTISAMYPNTKFFVYGLTNRPKAKRLIRDLPKNVTHVRIAP